MRDLVVGRFRVRAGKEGQKPRLDVTFPNLVLNVGLQRMVVSNSVISECYLGGGSAPIKSTDIDMENVLVTVSKSISNAVGDSRGCAQRAPFYSFWRRKYTFNNLSKDIEVTRIGTGERRFGDASTRYVFSIAATRDAVGNEASLTFLQGETISIDYEVRQYTQDSDTVGTVSVVKNGATTEHNFTARPANVTTSSTFRGWSALRGENKAGGARVHSGGIADWDSAPVTGEDIPDPKTAPSGASVSYTILVPEEKGNFPTGIKSLSATLGSGYYQIEFSPPIVKNSSEKIEIVLTNSWGANNA